MTSHGKSSSMTRTTTWQHLRLEKEAVVGLPPLPRPSAGYPLWSPSPPSVWPHDMQIRKKASQKPSRTPNSIPSPPQLCCTSQRSFWAANNRWKLFSGPSSDEGKCRSLQTSTPANTHPPTPPPPVPCALCRVGSSIRLPLGLAVHLAPSAESVASRRSPARRWHRHRPLASPDCRLLTPPGPVHKTGWVGLPFSTLRLPDRHHVNCCPSSSPHSLARLIFGRTSFPGPDTVSHLPT